MRDVNELNLGSTSYGLSGSIDTADYGATVGMEGIKRVFMPYKWLDATVTYNRNAEVNAILVRNVSGITLIGGLAVTWKTGQRGKRVDGYATYGGTEVAGFVDPWLTDANGVRNGDLFWLVVKGPIQVRTPIAQFTAWAEGDILISALTSSGTFGASCGATTATTTGGTTANDAGRLTGWTGSGLTTNITGTTTQAGSGLPTVLLNRIGRAISACTSNGTAARPLVQVHIADW